MRKKSGKAGALGCRGDAPHAVSVVHAAKDWIWWKLFVKGAGSHLGYLISNKCNATDWQ